jgi:hypothetical protein
VTPNTAVVGHSIVTNDYVPKDGTQRYFTIIQGTVWSFVLKNSSIDFLSSDVMYWRKLNVSGSSLFPTVTYKLSISSKWRINAMGYPRSDDKFINTMNPFDSKPSWTQYYNDNLENIGNNFELITMGTNGTLLAIIQGAPPSYDVLVINLEELRISRPDGCIHTGPLSCSRLLPSSERTKFGIVGFKNDFFLIGGEYANGFTQSPGVVLRLSFKHRFKGNGTVEEVDEVDIDGHNRPPLTDIFNDAQISVYSIIGISAGSLFFLGFLFYLRRRHKVRGNIPVNPVKLEMSSRI